MSFRRFGRVHMRRLELSMTKPLDDNQRALADAYFDAKREQAEIEARVSALREQLLELNRAVVEGHRAIVTVTEQERQTMDATEVRKLLTPRQAAGVMRKSKSLIVRAHVKAPERRA